MKERSSSGSDATASSTHCSKSTECSYGGSLIDLEGSRPRTGRSWWNAPMAPTRDVLHGHAGDAVAAGNVVFTSGCTAERAGKPIPSRVEDQVELALDHARRSLESLGSGMENVVKTLFLLTSLDD